MKLTLKHVQLALAVIALATWYMQEMSCMLVTCAVSVVLSSIVTKLSMIF